MRQKKYDLTFTYFYMFQVVVASNIIFFLLCCLVSLPACHLQIISGIWGPPQWNFRISHPEVFEETLYFDAAMRSAAAGYMAAFGLTMQSLFTYSN